MGEGGVNKFYLVPPWWWIGGSGTKERGATLTGWFGSGSAFAPGTTGPRVHNKTQSCFTSHLDHKKQEDGWNKF